MKSLKKITFTILPLLLGVFLIYKSFDLLTAEQFEKVKLHFKNAHYQYILLSLLFMKLSQASRAIRWSYAIQHLGYKTNFIANFIAISIGYMVNLTIPRSGEISRALILKKHKNIPFDKAFGTIVAERIVDFILLATLCFTGLLLNYKLLYQFALQFINIRQLSLLLTITAIIGITILYFLLKTKKVRKFFNGFIEGLYSILKMKKRMPFILHSLFIWVAFILSFYFGTLAIDGTSQLSANAILASFITGSIVISFTNGGIGAFPLLIGQILLSYHIPLEDGTAFGWLLWSSQTLLVILLGAISLLYLSIFSKK
ncbi:YbhN family protein [Capnocytophaga sp. ARDL2]|uniref:lysylphosphatidylglycerol synthase transmembrane domain-containing protein n=1 Tax=Capnocytophaga sp. ARDL2 TaxID=3238809 RepID=UPI0035578F05